MDLRNSTAVDPQGNLRQHRQVLLSFAIAVAKKVTNKANAEQPPGVDLLGGITPRSGLDPLDVVRVKVAHAKSTGVVRDPPVDQDVLDLLLTNNEVEVLNVIREARTGVLEVVAEDLILRIPDRLTPLEDRGVTSGKRIILIVVIK